jgi:hypothetical protein
LRKNLVGDAELRNFITFVILWSYFYTIFLGTINLKIENNIILREGENVEKWEEERYIYRVLIGGNKFWNLLKKKFQRVRRVRVQVLIWCEPGGGDFWIFLKFMKRYNDLLNCYNVSTNCYNDSETVITV